MSEPERRGRLGFVAGSALHRVGLGEGRWEAIHRHGDAYVVPHRIDHVANMRALAEAGCDRVLALGSVGGLRAELEPGTLLCPDDFIALDSESASALEGPGAHRVPGFDAAFRADTLAALSAAGAGVVDGGVYWQARGPRLETPAEIGFIASHADVIGMTVASECIAAGELGLRYAAFCSVDNLANGVGGSTLTLAELEQHRITRGEELARLVRDVLGRLA